ncbi:heme A synthase [Sphingomonas sp. Leaf357]|uniref:COX15/CtaA family protein n=1 Tax=Sphingomonas sp. Leaf357 TaxID=1736350 RepID=UPI0006FAD12D|nr:COX15/CtaA family protein [Sphingomonas sp. Leaf357]KQS01755.1 heme A synthase [Sphingomonas sp. Leaf357]
MLQASTDSPARPRALSNWLFVVAALIVLIVVVGGITRLTESGLSITDWKPITGIVPPLTDAQWQAEFANYRKIPQYTELNAGMGLAGFKAIFFWEYLHRFLGRFIGMAFLLPLIWFAVRRRIPRGYAPRLVALFSLILLQGTLGWLMVRSGLTDRTAVAPGWLATHLLTALFTLAGMVWTALDLRALARGETRTARLTALTILIGIVLFVQILYGALMAGLRAGLVAHDWPLMNGALFPGASNSGESIGTLLFGDPAIVHFIHRWWAWIAFAALIVLARAVKRAGQRPAAIAIHAALGLQILLGIATVMSDVNITLAALHQLVGALLLIAAVWGAHAIGQSRRA